MLRLSYDNLFSFFVLLISVFNLSYLFSFSHLLCIYLYLLCLSLSAILEMSTTLSHVRS